MGRRCGRGLLGPVGTTFPSSPRGPGPAEPMSARPGDVRPRQGGGTSGTLPRGSRHRLGGSPGWIGGGGLVTLRRGRRRSLLPQRGAPSPARRCPCARRAGAMDPTQAAAAPAVGLQVRPVQEEWGLDQGLKLRCGPAMPHDVAPPAPAGASDGARARAVEAADWRSRATPATGPQGAGRTRSWSPIRSPIPSRTQSRSPIPSRTQSRSPIPSRTQSRSPIPSRSWSQTQSRIPIPRRSPIAIPIPRPIPRRPPEVTRRRRPREAGGRSSRGERAGGARGGRRRRGAARGAAERDFRCAKCGRSFRHTHLTIRVRNGPPGERPGRRAASAFSSFSKPLGRRASASASAKPYRCARCGKAFGRVSGLAAHRRAHAGERPHGCGECGKTFRSRAALAGHEKTHAGPGPFACGVCEKSFLRKAHLAQHQRAHAE